MSRSSIAAPLALAVAVVLALALAGCSSPAPAAGGPSGGAAEPGAGAAPATTAAAAAGPKSAEDVDACAALPMADLASATGREYTRDGGLTSAIDDVPLATCTYQGASDDLQKALVLTTYLFPAGGTKAIAAAKKQLGGGSWDALAGVGDEAWSSDGAVIARYGDAVVTVIDVVAGPGNETLSTKQLSGFADTASAAL